MTEAAAPGSAPAAPPAGGAATPPGGSPPAGGAPPPAAPTRPEWLPEAHWDAAAGIKPEFGAHYAEIATFHKTETERLATLPQRAEQYAIKLPETLKAPDGMSIKPLPADHPMVMAARDFALKNRLPQEAFNDLVAFDAKMKIESFNAAVEKAKPLVESGQIDQATYGQMLKRAGEGADLGKLVEDHIAEGARQADEDKKLGEKVGERKSAVGSWVKGLLDRKEISDDEYAEARMTAATAAGVTFLEKLIAKSNGAVPGVGGAPPPPPQQDTRPIEQRWYGGQKG